MTPAPADLIGAREACELAGISRSTLTYWMLRGRLAPERTFYGPSGRAAHYLFDPAAVLAAKASA